MILYSEPGTAFPSGFFHMSESVMSHRNETKAVSWKNHSSVFVFIPFLARSPISFTAWNLETFAVLPGGTGCSHAAVKSQVTVGIPTRGHALGNPDWSLKEQRQSWGDAATPGHQVHTCH